MVRPVKGGRKASLWARIPFRIPKNLQKTAHLLHTIAHYLHTICTSLHFFALLCTKTFAIFPS